MGRLEILVFCARIWLVRYYIPLIGNHDVWYDSNNDPTQSWFEKPPEEIFNQIFAPEYDYLKNCVLPGWANGPTHVGSSYFQNFAFDYMRYHFIGLDWNSRSDFGNPVHGCPDLNTVTWSWLASHLTSYQNMGAENLLLFAHYPLSPQAAVPGCPPSYNFRITQLNTIASMLSPYASNVDKWFAGHWHNCGVWPIPPCEETVNSVLTNIVTKSVTDFLNPEAPSLRLVRVHDELKVDFGFAYIQIGGWTVNTPIPFVDQSTDTTESITNWDWNFGDSSPDATIQNPPPHPYAAPGVYKVTLTVTTQSGEKGSIAKAVDVGTKHLTSDYPDATAYNNARKFIFDPQSGALHLVYTTGPGPSMLTYSKSTNQGGTWFEFTPELLWGGHPALDVNTSGKPCVVENWAGIGSGFDAKRREKPLGWFQYDGISDPDAAFGYPSMVADSAGTLHIAISYSTTAGSDPRSEIRYYQASPGGRVRVPQDSTYLDYEVIARGVPGDCQFASIALDSNETPHVAWQQSSSIYYSYRQRPNTPNPWSTPLEISGSPCINGYHPSIVAGDSGDMYFVWEGNYQAGPGVYGKAVWFSMYDAAAGAWLIPEIVSGVSIAAESYPQVVYKNGLRFVVWSDLRSTGNSPKYDIYYSKHIIGGWSARSNLSATLDKDSKFPQAAIVSNNLCVAWTEGDNSPYEIRSQCGSKKYIYLPIIVKNYPGSW